MYNRIIYRIYEWELRVISMVLIRVKPEDKDKVFEILADNGAFTGLPNNKFLIIENVEAVLNKLKDAGIEVVVIQ